jgi:VanZ family protein
MGDLKKSDILALISWIMVLVIAILIFVVSSIPAQGYPSGLGIKTKIYHFSVFFALCFFLCLSIVQQDKQKKYLVYIAIILSMLYALIDESHQLFVPGRSGSVTDILIDSIGSLSGAITYSFAAKI